MGVSNKGMTWLHLIFLHGSLTHKTTSAKGGPWAGDGGVFAVGEGGQGSVCPAWMLA